MAQDPLRLFKEFISAAASVEIFPRPEYLVAVQTLCEKAPVIARFLVKEIPRHLQEDGDEADLEGQKERVDNTVKSPGEIAAWNVTPQASAEISGHSNDQPLSLERLPGSAVFVGNSSSALVLPSADTFAAGIQGQSTTVSDRTQEGGIAESSCAGTQIPINQRPAIPPHKPGPGPAIPFTALIHGKNGDIGTTSGHGGLAVQARFAQLAGHSTARPTTAPDDRNLTAEISPTRLMDLDEPNNLVPAASPFEPEQQLVKPEVLRSTPEAQIIPHEQQSPQTEEIPRTNGPVRLETSTLRNILGEMIDVVAELSRSQGEPPTGAHSAILRGLQPGVHPLPRDNEVAGFDTIWTTDPITWSGHIWINILEAGERRSRKTTIFNMIEYMGVSVWYDAQVAAFEAPLTKRGKQRKRVASLLLDSLLKKENKEEKPRERRKLALGNAGEDLSTGHSANISKDVALRRRRRIIERAGKGHQYSRREGRTDLSLFLASLESRGMLPSEEISELQAKFGLETESIPKASANANVDDLTARLYQLVDKSDSDEVVVGDAVELSLESFDGLRSDQWLDMWLIAAAMELTDKPSCVRYDLSVPLDQDNDGKVVPIAKPFGLWRRKIDKYRREIKDDARQIYFCPLNLDTDHFTLLEINEQQRMIYHYNSMAGHDVTRSKAKRTRAEFKDLGFGYEEAPCPQQQDGSSCGLMVIRNAALRMNGHGVGNWDDKLRFNFSTLAESMPLMSRRRTRATSLE
ncbi:hypothetical protein DL766_002066 [Monosporascus sp. MC13-8B]|uniref:Ubiquitin-like protease family profile domain-containing protein n=1 Tax=Monosporascus cannonballus TaxID=155416 RepID=A0ABY0HJX1_9PEZI|nr:hypothetical protein DL762_000136 [Monosporascus cannonballus]RYO99309.1 hypothetical protein DL763_001588 [Monosporascus cannonballus]RYP36254.1 hypothetical protein DL766_002066 [Monosporascus sp. MC13-8B]